MPTRLSRSRATGWAALRDMPRCRSRTSVTCRPTGTTGFSDDRGSWKIIAMSRPRRSRIAFSSSPSRLVPSKLATPSTLLPRLGSRPMIASDVTDLPQPDSPTRPTVWPGRTSKLMPSTAMNGFSPCRVNVTLRSRTDSSGSSPRAVLGGGVAVAVIRKSPPALGVEGLEQRLAHEGEAERHEDDAQRRVDREVRVVLDVLLRPAQHLAPLGRVVVGVAEAEEGQGGGVDDGGGEHQGGLHDDRPDRVRHHVPEHDGALPDTQRP